MAYKIKLTEKQRKDLERHASTHVEVMGWLDANFPKTAGKPRICDVEKGVIIVQENEMERKVA